MPCFLNNSCRRRRFRIQWQTLTTAMTISANTTLNAEKFIVQQVGDLVLRSSWIYCLCQEMKTLYVRGHSSIPVAPLIFYAIDSLFSLSIFTLTLCPFAILVFFFFTMASRSCRQRSTIVTIYVLKWEEINRFWVGASVQKNEALISYFLTNLLGGKDDKRSSGTFSWKPRRDILCVILHNTFKHPPNKKQHCLSNLYIHS